MKHVGIVKCSMHEEFPKGMKVVGKYVEPYPFNDRLHWLRVKTEANVNREILVQSVRPLKPLNKRG